LRKSFKKQFAQIYGKEKSSQEEEEKIESSYPRPLCSVLIWFAEKKINLNFDNQLNHKT